MSSRKRFILVALAIALASFIAVRVGKSPAEPEKTAIDSTAPAGDGWMTTETSITLDQTASPAIVIIEGVVPDLGAEAKDVLISASLDGKDFALTHHGPGAFCLRTASVAGPGSKQIKVKASATQVLPAPDGRMVGARLLRVAIKPVNSAHTEWNVDQDVVPPEIVLGDGWYPVEFWKGERFQWMGPQGEVLVAPQIMNSDVILSVTAEPGPGSLGGAKEIQLVDCENHLLDKAVVRERLTFDLILPASARDAQPFRLLMPGKGASRGDPRQLQVRIFGMKISAGSKPEGK